MTGVIESVYFVSMTLILIKCSLKRKNWILKSPKPRAQCTSEPPGRCCLPGKLHQTNLLVENILQVLGTHIISSEIITRTEKVYCVDFSSTENVNIFSISVDQLCWVVHMSPQSCQIMEGKKINVPDLSVYT